MFKVFDSMDKESTVALLKVYMVNGTAVGMISLSTVKDVVAIALGLISIISTLIIIRNNLKQKNNATTQQRTDG